MNQKLNKYKQLFYFLLKNKEKIKGIIHDLYDIYLRIRGLYDEYEALYRRTEAVGGIIDDEPQETDYIVGTEGGYELLENKNPYKYISEFNQHKGIHKSSCTIFACIGMVNYNMGLKFKQEDVEKYSKELIDKGIIVVGVGAYTSKVVDKFRRILKRDYNIDAVYLTIPIKSDLFEKALNNGWAFEIGYRTDKKHFRDIQEDGVLDGCEYNKVGGHAVWIRKADGDLEIINSYKGIVKYNRYIFKKGLRQLRCLVDKGKYYANARILLYKKDLNMPMNDIQLIEKAIELGITNDKTLLEKVKVGNYDVDVRNTIRIMRGLEKCGCLKSKKK